MWLKRAELSLDMAQRIGSQIGIDWEQAPFSVEQFMRGIAVELEHKDVTHGDPQITGKIAWAHLRENPKYYDILDKVGL